MSAGPEARVPPHSDDAERSVLGAILLEGEVVARVLPLVSADDFYATPHQLIYAACVRLRQEGKPIDPVLIKVALEGRGDLEKVGGEPYLAQLAADVPSAAGAEDYARTVRQKAREREVLSACMLLVASIHGGGGDVAAAARRVSQAADRLSAGGRPGKPVLAWRPFPVGLLPEPCRGFVNAAAKAIRCDPSLVALPLLAALAGCIGNKRRIVLKPGWAEPSVVWAVPIAESGQLKSPAFDAAMDDLRRREAKLIEEHRRAVAEYDAAMDEWKRNHVGPRPEPPPAPRLLVSDVTVEALAARLLDNPRGLLLTRDELAAWFKGFDKYRDGRGGDAQNWLEMHGARQIIVDRKGERAPVSVPHAAVSITGGIQPEVLVGALRHEHFVNGMAARLLFAMPPGRDRVWTDATIAEETRGALDALYGSLLALPFAPGPAGGLRSLDVPLSAEAREVWIAFYNEQGKRITGAPQDLSAAFSKLEGYAARFALTFHTVKVVTDKIDDGEIDVESMKAGIDLARWFVHETERVYEALREPPEARARRALAEEVRRLGGRVTPRELVRGGHRYDGAGGCRRAEDDLAGLAAAGLGTWRPRVAGPGTSGGRPADEFVLFGADADGTDRHSEQEPEGVTSAAHREGPDASADGTSATSGPAGGEVPSTSAGGDDAEERTAIQDEASQDPESEDDDGE